MFTPQGKFGWYELMTSDTKAAGKFYSDVVGWTTQEVPGDGPAYTVFNLGNVGIAGMLTIPGHVAWVFIPAGDKQFKRVEVQDSARQQAGAALGHQPRSAGVSNVLQLEATLEAQ